MFNKNKFRDFVLSKVLNNNYKEFDILIESLLESNKSPAEFTKLSVSTVSKRFKGIFISSNKPRTVSYRNWLLNKYNYKKCSSCKLILELKLFGNKKNTWDKLYSTCKSCDKKRSKRYREEYSEKIKLRNKIYDQNNKDKVNAKNSLKRARKLQRTPKWLTKGQIKEIVAFYTEAQRLTKETGIQHHVDHGVPLKGKNVSGLHVPWNLQILTAKENVRKSNKWEL